MFFFNAEPRVSPRVSIAGFHWDAHWGGQHHSPWWRRRGGRKGQWYDPKPKQNSWSFSMCLHKISNILTPSRIFVQDPSEWFMLKYIESIIVLSMFFWYSAGFGWSFWIQKTWVDWDLYVCDSGGIKPTIWLADCDIFFGYNMNAIGWFIIFWGGYGLLSNTINI